MPSRRRNPTLGAPVSIFFFAKRARGTIEDIQDNGRRLLVLTEEGELLPFVLSAMTGYFMREGEYFGPHLTFEDTT